MIFTVIFIELPSPSYSAGSWFYFSWLVPKQTELSQVNWARRTLHEQIEKQKFFCPFFSGFDGNSRVGTQFSGQ